MSSASALSLRHALLALIVVIVWGTNSVVIKLTLVTYGSLFGYGASALLLAEAHLGHKTQSLSGCFILPACASARSPQPQK